MLFLSAIIQSEELVAGLRGEQAEQVAAGGSCSVQVSLGFGQSWEAPQPCFHLQSSAKKGLYLKIQRSIRTSYLCPWSTSLREHGFDLQKHCVPPERDLQIMTQKAGSKQLVQRASSRCPRCGRGVHSLRELPMCAGLGQYVSSPMSKEKARPVAGAPQPLQHSGS